jgi:hypothetical protein
MFGFFGKKKALNQIAANIATMINVSVWPLRTGNNGNLGKLPEKMLTDKFVLGYIYGVAGGGIHVARISSTEEKGTVLFAVFELLFPGVGRELTNNCTRWVNSKDETFLGAVNIGLEESSVFYKALLAGDENAMEKSTGCLKSFDRHIEANYEKENDT